MKEFQLGDLLDDIVGGGTPSKRNDDYWNGGTIPWASVKDMPDGKYRIQETEDHITEEGLQNSSSNLIPKGTVITSTRMGLGRSFINEVDMAINQDLKALFPNGKLHNEFLLWWLASKANELESIGTGTTVKGIRLEQLRALKVNLPDLKIQKRIASILSSFDNLIENNTRRIEILEEMARRIYREWFVHFRYPGHQEDELVDSGTDEFDWVPEEWDMLTMEEILEHYIGGTWGQEEPEGEENNLAYVIRGTDIPGARAGNVDDIPLRYHKQSYINSRKLQDGDLVFEVSGGSKDQPVGRAMLITDTFLTELDCDDVVHASFCKLLRPDKSILKPEILYLHIREIYDDRRIMKYQVQSTGITNFKFSFFAENKQMFIPQIEIQEKFQEIVRPLFKQMYTLGKQNNRLKETRDLLLPKLISGKIDVNHLMESHYE